MDGATTFSIMTLIIVTLRIMTTHSIDDTTIIIVTLDNVNT